MSRPRGANLLGIDGKRCTRCRLTKPARDFKINRQTTDGLQAHCRVCQRIAGAFRPPRTAAQTAERNRRRREGRKRGDAYQYKPTDPQRLLAWQMVKRAIRHGVLVRADKCERCGKACRPEASHGDYAKPLDVQWLCKPCHIKRDRPVRSVDKMRDMPEVIIAKETWARGLI